MDGYSIKFTGAIRFTDTINIGIYVFEKITDPTDIKIVIKNEVSGAVIYQPEFFD